MCYVVAWNVTNEICKVMFLGELIHGFSYLNVSPFKGFGAQFGPLKHALL
jgi:hypothetical protein